MLEIIFNIFNTGILIFWMILLLFPKQQITRKITNYPWVPLAVALGYIYFLLNAESAMSGDFTTLEGLTLMFQNATPEGVAAGWLHYLAFDFWVGCWMLKDSQQRKLKHGYVILPLGFTFILGPVGILFYTIILGLNNKLKSTPN